MELVPVIYNSLLVVFSLLGSILVFSFIYSKVFANAESANRMADRKFNNLKQYSVAPKKREETTLHDRRIVEDVNRTRPVNHEIAQRVKVEKELIALNKVRVISRHDQDRRESIESNFVNSVSRYTVVNSFAREKSNRNDLYKKFSKMSVEYSQTA